MRQCARCAIELGWSDGQLSCITQRPKIIHELLCYPCYHEKTRIKGQINVHRIRARKLGLPATLTLEQWQATQKDFNGKCAYCLERPYQVLEHFIPLTRGGGTTKNNIVPACDKCNRKKRNRHPNEVKLIPRKDIQRVYEHLMSFEKS